MQKISLIATATTLMLSFGVSATEASLATVNIGSAAPLVKHQDLTMYDSLDIEKEQGIKRHVIALSPLDNEYEAKVELRVKKVVEADCNSRNLAVEIKEKTVEGWGYNYHVVNFKGIQSTMMLCSEEANEKTLYSQPQQLLRYNSRLPMIVYTPNDVELDVRIWTPSPTN